MGDDGAFAMVGDDIFTHLASVSLREIFTRRCQEMGRNVALWSICPGHRRNFWKPFWVCAGSINTARCVRFSDILN